MSILKQIIKKLHSKSNHLLIHELLLMKISEKINFLIQEDNRFNIKKIFL